MQIPEVSFFIHEIDMIDNAACTWLTLLSGINLNVYMGFQTEWELSEYFLTRQYVENITAIAGKLFSFYSFFASSDFCEHDQPKSFFKKNKSFLTKYM